jgi:DNA-binding NarL/FixJ family response regulator
MPQHSVLLVEDERETAARLAEVIRGEPRLSLVGVAATCAEGMRLLPLVSPDLLAVDLGLPDARGTELIRFARRESPRTEIMVMTVFGDERSVIAALEAGAAGYVLKDGTPQQIARALLELAVGGSPISPAIARHLLRRFRSDAPVAASVDGEEPPALSGREVEVLRLIAKGFRVPEIAGLLGISAHTVTTHVRRLYKKLEVSSHTEAVYEAVQRGLLRMGE